MFYQKCTGCESEWNGKKELEECPFCNEKLQILPKNFGNIDEALSYIFSKYGFEIIEQRRKFIGLLSDYAPSLNTERNLIMKALNSGVYSELLKENLSDPNTQLSAKNRAVSILTKREFLDPAWAEKAVLLFISHLSGQKHKISFQNINSNIPTISKTESADQRKIGLINRFNKLLSVGEHILFGRYPYSNAQDIRGIEWEVLDIKDNKALLLSTYCIDAQPYHTKRMKISWEYCYLRSWLKDVFYEKAFTNEEKYAISDSLTESTFNDLYASTDRKTKDKLFILSCEEIVNYKFKIGQSLVAKATPFGIAKGIYRDHNDDSAFWWVRTHGNSRDTLMFVSTKGKIDKIGNFVDQPNKGIRPALWVDLNLLNTILERPEKE